MSAVHAADRIDRLSSSASRLFAQPPWSDLRTTPFTDIQVSGVVGAGRRCIAFAAAYGGRQVVLKVYRPQAVAKHARRLGCSLARYEYERNVALRGVAKLAPHIPDPIACFSSSRCELFIQERVLGQPLDAFLRTCSATARAFVLGEIRLIVERAHEAGIFDLDLHPRNVLVRRSARGTVQPVLFDFNKTPYHVQPPNPLATLLLKLGCITPASRDLRYLRRLSQLEEAPG